MLRDFQRLKKCPAVDFGRFDDLFCSHGSGIAFQTTQREPAAYIETLISIPQKSYSLCKMHNILTKYRYSDNFPCDSCIKSAHHLRTSRSRKSTDNIEEKQTKFKRLDQLEHSELLKTAREASQQFKLMHDKVRRLDAYKCKIENVGSKTNDNLTQMFRDLQTALKEKRNMSESPVCKWDSCNKQFGLLKEENKYQLRRKSKFILPRLKTELGRRSIRYRGPVIWNSIEEGIKESSYSNFKKQLYQIKGKIDSVNLKKRISRDSHN
eukprot:Seg5684.1 transcript_id=Seg5684.1/GoldUCD/mRNA.D3Y31 product="hypothetical protein" protein_id=Seg5684.1/GoldUCD/D3Y31